MTCLNSEGFKRMNCNSRHSLFSRLSWSRLCWIGACGFLLSWTGSLFGQLELRPADNLADKELPAAEQPNLEMKVAKKKQANKFLRMQRSDKGEPLTLQTAITSYKLADRETDLQVDLVGAVHVGDKEYYQQLNKKFESYDVVLYELVAPQGTRVPKGGRKGGSSNPISMLQGMTQSMLKLASQMEEVDYTKRNFVHADMSPEEMQAAMAKRGETTMTLALDAFSEAMKQANLRQEESGNEGAVNEDLQKLAEDPLSLLFDPQRDSKLKIMMAEQFSTMGTDVMGGSVNRLLIEDRNAAAMKVFNRELLKGHKRIAIFYGAAHLPDFEERLADLGFRPSANEWLTAWDLTKKSTKKKDPVNDLLQQLLAPPKRAYQ